MRKKLAFILPVSILILLFHPQSQYAFHQKEVLGERTSADQVKFPPVTAGAGLILPDSPIYFLDKWVQQAKILTARSPEKKAQVRSEVAGERLAELKVMMSKNETQGIQTALEELEKEIDLASKEIKQASAEGKDIWEEAVQLNGLIKKQRDLLLELAQQTEGSLSLRLESAGEALTEAKTHVEDGLPPDELEKEIRNEIERRLEKELKEATDSVRKIEIQIEELRKLASESADKNLEEKEELIKKAIEEKNDELRRTQERLLQMERERKQKAAKVADEARERAQKTYDEATKTAEKYRELRKIYEPPSGSLPTGEDSGVCTQDAKTCPNGTSVGRVPPLCDFAPCPGGDITGD